MHGKYSPGLSLDGRVIDIITRETRMRRPLCPRPNRCPLAFPSARFLYIIWHTAGLRVSVCI